MINYIYEYDFLDLLNLYHNRPDHDGKKQKTTYRRKRNWRIIGFSLALIFAVVFILAPVLYYFAIAKKTIETNDITILVLTSVAGTFLLIVGFMVLMFHVFVQKALRAELKHNDRTTALAAYRQACKWALNFGAIKKAEPTQPKAKKTKKKAN
ncbi:hypothetical protein [Mycoplasmopsis columbinasalis]|uniref:Uncharacterized protein n=1 Tax=Mycoplasmopsis columbinasalis TaxID=114880 RepID=A0A449BA18_9BACT|nr:hypothetical protein [Mycoplasmopsis columbinasalis]VEU77956.1 Uncharacterised protein [Mycoplasmopsis columbinasalis]